MGIRTFFLQPFKIPTGSMQPTLYGVTQEDLRGTDVTIPNRLSRFFQYWFNGVSYFHVVAENSGMLTYDDPTRFVLFNLKQAYYINDVRQGTIWFPPDGLFGRAGMPQHSPVQAGQDIVKLRVISGDHLFVDRLTYNFRRPRRGEIVVFETHGIPGIVDPSGQPQDTYYIKRLCGLGNETLQLTKDFLLVEIPRPDLPRAWAGHMLINGTNEITANTPHFENLYSFPDATSGTNKVLQYQENHYVGHGLVEALAPDQRVHVRPDHYFVMGDNTFNSSDSRYWGDFPREKVIGQSFFVYWPIGGTQFKDEHRESRFGWSHR
jgi:signal peptidase I